MDNKIFSKLQMLDLYFPKYNFEFVKTDEQLNLNINFNINNATKTDDKRQVRVTIETEIYDDLKRLNLKLQTVGIFKLVKFEGAEEEANIILTHNTVAIMMPYIRSQISLMTTQPGMAPIILPPINVDELLKNKN